MIVVFESKDSEKLSKYLKNFEEPVIDGSLRSIITAFALNSFHHKVYRVDDLVFISIKGFWEKMFEYGTYFVIIELILSVIFGWSGLLQVGFYALIFFFAMISADFRGWMIALKLKISGHKPKISFPKKEYVLDKLLFRVG